MKKPKPKPKPSTKPGIFKLYEASVVVAIIAGILLVAGPGTGLTRAHRAGDRNWSDPAWVTVHPGISRTKVPVVCSNWKNGPKAGCLRITSYI